MFEKKNNNGSVEKKHAEKNIVCPKFFKYNNEFLGIREKKG